MFGLTPKVDIKTKEFPRFKLALLLNRLPGVLVMIKAKWQGFENIKQGSYGTTSRTTGRKSDDEHEHKRERMKHENA